MLLSIELVPATCWYSNVRSNVSTSKWRKICKQVYAAADYKCEICGGVGRRHPVECHEVWIYNDEKNTQTLDRMIALCPQCHEVKHIGLALVRGNLQRAANHFAKVNKINTQTAEREIEKAFEIHERRSQHQWELNIEALDEYN